MIHPKYCLHHYKCKLLRIIDGDTLECTIDLGFDVWKKATIRLIDIDAPEVKTLNLEEKVLGKLSTQALTEIMDVEKSNGNFYIHSKTVDSFGRSLATIYLESGLDVNAHLIELGYATKWKI